MYLPEGYAVQRCDCEAIAMKDKFLWQVTQSATHGWHLVSTDPSREKQIRAELDTKHDKYEVHALTHDFSAIRKGVYIKRIPR